MKRGYWPFHSRCLNSYNLYLSTPFKFFFTKNFRNNYMLSTNKFILLILLGISVWWVTLSKAEGLPVVRDLTVEAKASQKLQAPILVLFMSQSCNYCEQALQDYLLPMYHDPEYKSKAIFRQVETSNTEKVIGFKGEVTTQRDLANKYRAWTVPTIILFDSTGQEVNRIVGLLTADYYLAHLDSTIDDAQARIKAAAK